jgi:hypothetical protein
MARVKKEPGNGAPTPIAVLGPNGETILTSPALPGPVSSSELVKTGSELARVIEKADKEARVEKARGVVFDSANKADEKPMPDRFLVVVDRAFRTVDAIAVLDRYEAWLELGDKRTEEGFIRAAHERGPKIVQDLFDAYIHCRQDRETWELENDVVLGSMRMQATDLLQAEKERGTRTKAITEKDLDLKCAEAFPDEWPRQESRRLRFKLTEDRMKFAIENAQLRCRILDSMMARLR